MPPELMELYSLYQQELQTRHTEQEAVYLSELNTMLRVGTIITLSLSHSLHSHPQCCP